MFININKYTFSYVTFLIVKKKEGGWTRAVVSDDIVFLQKLKKMKIFWKCILFLHFFQTRQCKRRL